MRVFVTGGGLGFIGGHVVRALRAAGHDVRHHWVDVRDADGLQRAFTGCDAVLHVAALYSFDAPAELLEAVNVGGTRNVISACRRAGVGRLLQTSSSATCGPVPGRVATEADLPPAWEPIGEGDDAPTPTGRMVQGVASGRYRATLRGGGLNLVDVRDVAPGHVLALERGRRGERYLLGGVNLTLAEAFALIARAAGRRPPRLCLPYAAVRGARRSAPSTGTRRCWRGSRPGSRRRRPSASSATSPARSRTRSSGWLSTRCTQRCGNVDSCKVCKLRNFHARTLLHCLATPSRFPRAPSGARD